MFLKLSTLFRLGLTLAIAIPAAHGQSGASLREQIEAHTRNEAAAQRNNVEMRRYSDNWRAAQVHAAGFVPQLEAKIVEAIQASLGRDVRIERNADRPFQVHCPCGIGNPSMRLSGSLDAIRADGSRCEVAGMAIFRQFHRLAFGHENFAAQGEPAYGITKAGGDLLLGNWLQVLCVREGNFDPELSQRVEQDLCERGGLCLSTERRARTK